MTRPLQVYLDEPDLDRLEEWAKERGWTKSQAVRVAVRALTRRSAGDPLLDSAGMIDGLPADASERIESYLAETYVAESAPKYQAAPRARRPRVRR